MPENEMAVVGLATMGMNLARNLASHGVRVAVYNRTRAKALDVGEGTVVVDSPADAARDADVVAPGGRQRVQWRDDSVYLTGWAEVLFEGNWLR